LLDQTEHYGKVAIWVLPGVPGEQAYLKAVQPRGAYVLDALTRPAQKPDCPHTVSDGRELAEWFDHLESGPAFMRRDERVNWLADEHGICDRYAAAIVHEYAIQRRLRLFGA
jgi:hypothetical protein